MNELTAKQKKQFNTIISIVNAETLINLKRCKFRKRKDEGECFKYALYLIDFFHPDINIYQLAKLFNCTRPNIIYHKNKAKLYYVLYIDFRRVCNRLKEKYINCK